MGYQEEILTIIKNQLPDHCYLEDPEFSEIIFCKNLVPVREKEEFYEAGGGLIAICTELCCEPSEWTETCPMFDDKFEKMKLNKKCQDCDNIIIENIGNEIVLSCNQNKCKHNYLFENWENKLLEEIKDFIKNKNIEYLEG